MKKILAAALLTCSLTSNAQVINSMVKGVMEAVGGNKKHKILNCKKGYRLMLSHGPAGVCHPSYPCFESYPAEKSFPGYMSIASTENYSYPVNASSIYYVSGSSYYARAPKSTKGLPYYDRFPAETSQNGWFCMKKSVLDVPDAVSSGVNVNQNRDKKEAISPNLNNSKKSKGVSKQ